MENQNKSNDTVVVYTYRYIWKKQDGGLCVKFITGPQEEHALFQKNIVENEEIVSCLREYVNEINFAYLGFTEEVKVEDKVRIKREQAQAKQEKKNAKICQRKLRKEEKDKRKEIAQAIVERWQDEEI